jgi:hypothetical protein
VRLGISFNHAVIFVCFTPAVVDMMRSVTSWFRRVLTAMRL